MEKGGWVILLSDLKWHPKHVTTTKQEQCESYESVIEPWLRDNTLLQPEFSFTSLDMYLTFIIFTTINTITQDSFPV